LDQRVQNADQRVQNANQLLNDAERRMQNARVAAGKVKAENRGECCMVLPLSLSLI
jgi:hypothetical protein